VKWIKLGKIFDFYCSPFKDKFIGFAQSPQAIVFDDFIRIYFSTRKQTPNGKYLSIVQFIDMDKAFQKILDYSKETVIELGKLGTFDEHGIFPFSVLKHDHKIYAYTTGWTRRVSVSCDTGIGFTVSNDHGKTFEKYHSGPILTSSLHEPFLVCDAFVRAFNNTFYMWYIFGTDWKVFQEGYAPDRIYKIGYAISNDGINWRKQGKQIIADSYNDESQALPTVIKIQDKYHMFFCHRHSFDFRTNKEKSYRIGYAYSSDLINWTRNDAMCGIDVTPNEWDSDMMCYPNVFECNGQIYLLYNGNEFGKHGFGLATLQK
jgi:hypothetical protein